MIVPAGFGGQGVEFTIPDEAIAIAEIAHRGDRNFAVWALSPDGTENKLLVNEIGSYAGTVLFDEDAHSVAFKIEADGRWTIDVRHVSRARSWNGQSALEGTGSDVVRISPPPSGLTAVTLTHNGASDFAIFGFGTAGRSLLVNEIGSYTGETLLPAGTVVLEITADGAWQIVPQ